MKKQQVSLLFMVFILVASLLVPIDSLEQTAVAIDVSTGNLFLNPGFEEGDGQCPTDWSCTTYGSGGTLSMDSTVYKEGSWSGKLTDTNTSSGQFFAQSVPAEPGKQYDVTAWYKTEELATAPYVFVSFRDAANKQIKSEQIDGVGGTQDWALLEGRTSAAPEGTATVRFNFSMWATPGAMWWDEVSVTPYVPPLALQSVTLDVYDPELTVTESTYLHWSGLMNDYTPADPAQADSVVYHSLRPEIATLDQDTGVVTALDIGTALFSVEVAMDGVTKSAETMVSVIDPASGIIIKDRFNYDAAGSLPAGWNSTGSSQVADFPSASDKSLSLTSDTWLNHTYREFGSLTGSLSISYDLYADQEDRTVELAHVYDASRSSSPVNLSLTNKGMFHITDGVSRQGVDVLPYSSDTWYSIKYVVDIPAQAWDLYVDGTLVKSDIPFTSPVTELASVRYTTMDGSSAYIDDFTVATKGDLTVTDKPIYYVSPTGDDSQAGTLSAPWRTLDKASQAQAGDTIVFLPGEYEGILRPVNSGTEEAPIIYKTAQRQQATLVGLAEDDYHHAIEIVGKSYIQLEGLHTRPQNPEFGRWLKLDSDNGEASGIKSTNIHVTDMLMEKSSGLGRGGTAIPLLLKNSSHVYIKDNVIREFVGGDMTQVIGVDHMLFEGNSISKAGHSPVAFSPLSQFKSNEFIVIRGNVFHAGWGRPFELFGDANFLYEGNIIINAYHGTMSAGPDAKVMMEDSIFRFNRMFRNWGSPVNVEYQVAGADAKNSRYYHNVFDDNYQQAMRISNIVDNKTFKNNVFSRNDRFGGNSQVRFLGDASNFQFMNNVFWSEQGTPLLDNRGSAYTVSEVQTPAWQAENGEQFRDNKVMDPGFVDMDNYNHALASDSLLRDAAEHLTYAVGEGMGLELTVADARNFYDGFGLEGEQGDLIAVGRSSQTARVVHVDKDNHVLTLDRPVMWASGDAVSLTWAGEAPDIGVYEHGLTGRVSVQVVAEAFQVEVGEPAELKAIIHGLLDPAAYDWRLGDGTLATGSEVSKSYSEPGTYPIHVRVKGMDGTVFIGTGVVDVVAADHEYQPLISINYNEDARDGTPDFDNEDTYGWWFWYSSRPTTDTNVVKDETGNGSYEIRAASNDYEMPVRAFPAGWDIDKYPYVSFKYKIQPGMPIGLYLHPFGEIGSEGVAYIAAVDEILPQTEEAVSSLTILADDDEWHEVTIDVRAIREKFPNARVIDEIRFQALEPSLISQGDAYYLDDFSILPVSAGSETPEEPEQPVEPVTIDQLDEVLNDAADQGLISNHGVLISLHAKVRHLQENSDRDEQKVNALIALKHEVEAQSGKHIDSDFAESFLETIENLMNQY